MSVDPGVRADIHHVSDENLRHIVAQVWESLLQVPAEPAEPGAADAVGEPVRHAVIQVSGTWSAAVELVCGEDAAQGMARVMLALGDDEELTHVDVEDALGEVVNVVGGNVKALVAGSTALSLPSVRRGLPTTAGPLVSTVTVRWLGHPVLVAVRHIDPQTEPPLPSVG